MGKPKIRFKGYTDEWEQRKFSDCAQRESLFQTSSYDCPSVEYEDVIAEEGCLNKDIRLKEVQKTGIKFDGTQVLYGKLRPYLHNWLNPDFMGVAVGDWWVFRPVEIDKNFLYRLIQTKKFDNVANQSSGSKMPRADWNLVSQSEFIVPISLEEQCRIAEAFEELDRLITLHQRKYEQAKTLKKYMLQKMFPQDGMRVPEIRFAGFTDEWEQRKLNTITDVRDGTHDSPKYVEVGHPFITSKNVKDGYINYDDVQYVSDEDFEEINKRSKVDINDILMGMIGTVGNIALVRETPNFAIKNVALIKDTEEVFYLYLYHCLQSNSIVSQLSENLDGGTQKFIALNKIRNLNIPLPNKNEQYRVGNFLEILDNLITLHQRKCDELRKIKKYMLQNMFC
ncbi:MAG: restriction endonuclease subunit S [Mediterraneibacter sp.]